MAGGYSVTFTVVDNATKQIDQINRRMAAMRAPMERLSKQVSKFIDVSGLNTIAKGFASIGRAALGVLRTLVDIIPAMGAITGAASIAGMAKLVTSYASWSAQLTTTADNLGITTQQLQQFENATRLAGGNVGDMDAALQSLAKVSRENFQSGGTAHPDATYWFHQLGITLTDSHGKLKSVAELMPQVIQGIAGMENPASRVAASSALLNDEQAKLVETLRQSHRSWLDLMSDASRYTGLTDEEREHLTQFREALGHTETAFDTLGQHVAATLATNLTPFINKLGDFVDKHTPEILAAVDRLSAKFSAWLQDPETWKSIEAGLKSLMESLTWVSNHLSEIVSIAKEVAEVFITLWAVKALASIATLVTALGSVGGGGLIGSLAIAAALAALVWRDASKPIPLDKLPSDSPLWSVIPKDQQAQMPNSPLNKPQGAPAPEQHWYNPGSWFGKGGALGAIGRALGGGGGATAFEPAAKDITPEARGLLKTIAQGESKGDYNVLYGGSHFSGDQFPQWAGVNVGGAMTHAAGAYQFQPGTFEEAKSALGLKDFSPASQDRAAWWLAQRDYARRNAGRSLQDDLKDPKRADDIAATLGPTWTSTKNTNWAENLIGNERTAHMTAAAPPAAVASAPPAAVPPPAPVNGSVDVNITGKNLPPDSAVTAKGTGAVNVAPPRVEQQFLNSI